MKRIVLSLGTGFCLLITGCASGGNFLSNLNDAPKWFMDKIPEAEKEGYPTVASMPDNPEQIEPLASWDTKLETLKARGLALTTSERGQVAPADLNTQVFHEESLKLADVDQFNEDEAAAEAAAAAALEDTGN